MLVRARHARLGGDVLKLPIPEVSIKNVGPFQAAEVNVAPPVAIHIAQRDARAVFQDAIFGHRLVRQMITEGDAGGFSRQSRKTGFAAGSNWKSGAAESRAR